MKIVLILFFLSFSLICYAGISNTTSSNWTLLAPPKQLDTLGTYNYLHLLYSHFNQLETTTNNPVGVNTSQIGTMILYNNSGTYKFCVQTANPSGTVWKCSNLI